MLTLKPKAPDGREIDLRSPTWVPGFPERCFSAQKVAASLVDTIGAAWGPLGAAVFRVRLFVAVAPNTDGGEAMVIDVAQEQADGTRTSILKDGAFTVTGAGLVELELDPELALLEPGLLLDVTREYTAGEAPAMTTTAVQVDYYGDQVK